MPSISTIGKNMLTVAVALAAFALLAKVLPPAGQVRDFLLK